MLDFNFVFFVIRKKKLMTYAYYPTLRVFLCKLATQCSKEY